MVNLVADRQLIGHALAQLSAEHRDMIRRAYYQARTTAQIADDLHIADATVKSRLHYAMRALRRAVQEMGVTDHAGAVTPWAALDTTPPGRVRPPTTYRSGETCGEREGRGWVSPEEYPRMEYVYSTGKSGETVSIHPF